MKVINKLLESSGVTCASLILAAGTASAMTIVPTNDGNALVNNILGPGINIIPGSISYTGAPAASGIFTDGLSAGLGIDRGIILTTGSAVNALGPNNTTAKETENGLAGDADLNGLAPGLVTNDATSLSFNFESDGGDLFFNYVFTSEEYNEFVGSQFNDVFGFFLDGQNIALLPDGTTPVAINTVNQSSNSGFFVNNSPPIFDIQYDGFTTVLTAKFLGLSAGQHTLKLAIGDATDFKLDSAVFIQAGTLSSRLPTDIPEPALGLGLILFGIGGVSGLKRQGK
jgi:hypothetical protein